MRQILLFGDSLTQRGFEWETGGWAGLLANDYVRRADIINRGFGGYNTEWCRLVLPQLLPTLSVKSLALTIIFLGANDAVLPTNTHQHVPLGRYRENLSAIVSMMRVWKADLPLLVITPPAVYPPSWEAHCTQRGRPVDRSIEHTRSYAQVCREVCVEHKVPLVDLYAAMEDYAVGKQRQLLNSNFAKCPEVAAAAVEVNKNDKERSEFTPNYDPKLFNDLLCDGLHLSKAGNRLLYEIVKQAIADNYPLLISDGIPLQFPYHGDVNTADLIGCLKP